MASARNYQKANNTDVLDGDVESSIYFMKGDTGGEVAMYDYGKATLINNRVHVYKGGSWKERSYWLSPGARKFLNDDMSTDDIGFRCVVDRMGSQNLAPNKKKSRKFKKQ